MGINLLFTFFFSRDAGDEGLAISVESVQAGGADRTISWLVFIVCFEMITESGIGADVLPGPNADYRYAFPSNPSIRVLTLVRIIRRPRRTGTDVVMDILCLFGFSSRRRGCCRDVKNEEDTRELDKVFSEHCHGNVGREKTCRR